MEGYVITLDQQFLIQIGIQLLNTIIMCAGLSYLLYKPVTKYLNARKERIAGQIDSAEKRLSDAEKLKEQYESKLKEIDKERNEILEESRIRAAQREQQIISEAKKEADSIRQRAMLDIEREQEKAKDDIKHQIIEISSLMASHFIEASIDEKQQNKLVDEVISDLGDVKWLS